MGSSGAAMKKDVIIIGAGPAGLSAAIYVERAGKSAAVLEANTFGGQIVNTPDIMNYPGIKKTSGFDFAMGLYEQATELGAEVIFDKAVKIEKRAEKDFCITGASGEIYEAGAVILATGAVNRPLGFDNEKSLIGHGVSYCATCDGAFFKGKDVAVNGGGNTALEDAMFLTNYCNKVYIIHRREGFRGEPKTLEALRQKENVTFILNANVTKLIAEEKDKFSVLTGVEVTDKNTGEKQEIEVSGLFIAIGQMPQNEDFADVVMLDDAGYIEAGEDTHTGTPGIYAAGDGRTKKVRQLVTAAGDGAVAALEAVNYISN